jgi:hypothetical protein
MVRVQHRHKRWPFLNDPDTCMAMTMNSSLVASGQEVDYEETVADLEGMASRVVAWCGLE